MTMMTWVSERLLSIKIYLKGINYSSLLPQQNLKTYIE